MKIYPFTPQFRAKPEQLGKNTTTTGQSAGVTDFGKILTSTISASSPRQGAGQTVSLENHRALNSPSSLGDLGPIKTVLGRVHSSILNSTPDSLNKMHNLEGMIYVYSPGGN